MRVRGLKQKAFAFKNPLLLVAPHAGAWIETTYNTDSLPLVRSHPMRVRGLKLLLLLVMVHLVQVAPHAGAWIETNEYY